MMSSRLPKNTKLGLTKLTKASELPTDLRQALTRVLAMADDMSGENSYAEVDYAVVGGARIGVKPEVQHDLDIVRAWLNGATELPTRRR